VQALASHSTGYSGSTGPSHTNCKPHDGSRYQVTVDIYMVTFTVQVIKYQTRVRRTRSLVLCLPPLYAIPAHCQCILPPTTVTLVLPSESCLGLGVKIRLHHQSRSLRFNSYFPGGPGLASTRISPLWILLELMVMEVVVTTGTIRRAKLQSRYQYQLTNTSSLQSNNYNKLQIYYTNR